ncbi:hypothetical protein [Anaerostipes hominis (ex Lee et al. 2021)]|uniref:hypothetical protein n=1 Tax=Anaerostipes hominis (ex Lee et al. 2021) TaxID=2025494 RepID=UPI0022E04A3D|nr:hypothetical protein [Anaerostipes hominis (ex Lee et al. 2021)]
MQNFKPVIAQQLKNLSGVKQLGAGYPKDFAKMPTVTYSENDNSDAGYTSKEVVTDLEYQFDIWSKESTSSLALQLDDLITPLGFRRAGSNELVDTNTGLKHRIIRYRGRYDSIMERITQV